MYKMDSVSFESLSEKTGYQIIHGKKYFVDSFLSSTLSSKQILTGEDYEYLEMENLYVVGTGITKHKHKFFVKEDGKYILTLNIFYEIGKSIKVKPKYLVTKNSNVLDEGELDLDSNQFEYTLRLKKEDFLDFKVFGNGKISVGSGIQILSVSDVLPGPTGPQGDRGEHGHRGAIGPTGLVGPTGPKCTHLFSNLTDVSFSGLTGTSGPGYGPIDIPYYNGNTWNNIPIQEFFPFARLGYTPTHNEFVSFSTPLNLSVGLTQNLALTTVLQGAYNFISPANGVLQYTGFRTIPIEIVANITGKAATTNNVNWNSFIFFNGVRDPFSRGHSITQNSTNSIVTLTSRLVTNISTGQQIWCAVENKTNSVDFNVYIMNIIVRSAI